ncbi:MAG: tetratricopeptide repeat protein, partial [Blastochloris sp.]|nr:tetratricopeptide repeat protein [Blastochloris sp.]
MSIHEAYTCIVRFDGTPIGSGFLVHTSGLIATCHHVIAAAGQPVKDRVYHITSLRGKEAVPARAIAYNEKHDVALLQIEGELPSQLTVAELVHSSAIENQMHFAITAFGLMPDKDRRFEFVSAHGIVVGAIRHRGVDMIQLKSDEILRGMSGSPLTIPDLGGVVGVLSGRYNLDPQSGQWMQGLAWATQIEALAELDPRLIVGAPQPLVNPRRSIPVTIGSVDRLVQVTEAGLVNANNIQLTLSDDHWRQPNDQDPQRRWEGVIGREQDLEKIAAQLPVNDRAGQIAAVYGLAGIGKSALAAAFVDRYGGDFRGTDRGGILWASVSVNEPAQILNRWAALAYSDDALRMLQLGERPQFEASALKRILGGHGPLLVVIDDVRTVEEVQPLLDALPPEARILVTTRDLNVAEHFDRDPLHLREISSEDAVTLLERDIRNLELEELQTIAKAFGCHPQALRMICSLLKGREGRERRRTDMKALLQRLESGSSVSGSNRAQEMLRSVTEALRFIYDDISDDKALRNEYQRRMRRLGILAPSEADFSVQLAALLWDVNEDVAADFLELLRDKALLTPVSEGRWSQHALVRAVMRELLNEAEEVERDTALYNYVFYTTTIVAQFDQLLTKWDTIAPDLPHIYYVGELLCEQLEKHASYEQGKLSVEEVILLSPPADSDEISWWRKTQKYLTDSVVFLLNYPQPPHLIERWLTAGIVASRVLADIESEAQIWYYWHNYLFSQNRVPDSVLVLEYMRTIANQTSTPLEITVLALIELGQTYAMQGNTDIALESLQEAYELSAQQEDFSTALRVNVLASFGQISMMLSQSDQALLYLKEAYDLLNPTEINYVRLRVTQMLSLCYTELGKPEEALEFFSDATRYLDAPGALLIKATLLNNKGVIFSSRGETNQALECFNQALELAISTNDPSSQVSALNNIAQVKLGQDDYETARECLE